MIWFALFLSSLMVATAGLPQQRSFGYAYRSYIYISSAFVTNLSLTEEQRQMAERISKDFLSTRLRELRTRLTKASDGVNDLETYFKARQMESDGAREFNERMFDRIDALLDGTSQRQLFRRLLTQRLVSDGDFDALISIHGIEMSWREYSSFYEKVQQANASDETLPELVDYRAGLRFLSEEGGVNNIEELAGEEYPGTLTPTKRENAFGYNRSVVTLLGIPQVRKHLKLTLDQIRKLDPELKELAKSASPEKVRIAAIKDREAALLWIDCWNSQIKTNVNALLTEEQQKRLKQLGFQYHVRCLNLKQAVRDSRKEVKVDPSVSRAVLIESYYEMQFAKFNLYYPLFEELVGAQAARRKCGEFKPIHSMWRHHNVKADEAILRRVLKRSPTNKSGVPQNRRRKAAPDASR